MSSAGSGEANASGEEIVHPEGYRARRGRNWFFLGLTYASYYLCRYNLSPVANEIKTDLGLSNRGYGAINSGRDGTYAVGQMINGLFTDRIGGKQAMLIGALGTAALNLCFGFASWWNVGWVLPLLVLIRSADGYMQAFGAPGFIKINTAWFRRKERGVFAGIFGAMINLGAIGAGQLGTILATGAAIPLILMTVTIPKLDWRYMFFIPPFVVVTIAVIMSFIVKNQPEEAGFKVEHDEDDHGADPHERIRLRDVFAKIASNPIVWIVAGAYFCTGFVRRGIESWWSVYLKDVWGVVRGDDLFTIFVWGLPITATVGSIISGYVSDRFFEGKRAPVAAFLYVSQVVLTGAVLFIPQEGSHAWAWVSVGFVILISMMCNATHSILGTAAAMDLGGRKMAGCSSGIIDSFQYYGALLSGYGLGYFLDLFAKDAPLTTSAAALTTTAAAAASQAVGTATAHKPIDPTVWFSSLLPFGTLGAVLMTYLWLRHRGTDTRGA